MSDPGVVILQTFDDTVEVLTIQSNQVQNEQPSKRYIRGYEVDEIYSLSWYSEGAVRYTLESIQRLEQGHFGLSWWSTRIDVTSGYYISSSDDCYDGECYSMYATAAAGLSGGRMSCQSQADNVESVVTDGVGTMHLLQTGSAGYLGFISGSAVDLSLIHI